MILIFLSNANLCNAYQIFFKVNEALPSLTMLSQTIENTTPSALGSLHEVNHNPSIPNEKTKKKKKRARAKTKAVPTKSNVTGKIIQHNFYLVQLVFPLRYEIYLSKFAVIFFKLQRAKFCHFLGFGQVTCRIEKLSLGVDLIAQKIALLISRF